MALFEWQVSCFGGVWALGRCLGTLALFGHFGVVCGVVCGVGVAFVSGAAFAFGVAAIENIAKV